MASVPKRYARLAAADHARKLLRAANRAAKRLDKDDEQSLHSFRVRVRRLRAFLKTYRDLLGGSHIRTTCKKLGRLIDTTNTSRDIQVHLCWLNRAASNKRLEPNAQEAAAWLSAQLQNHPESHTNIPLDHLKATFDKATRSLRARLKHKGKQASKASSDDQAHAFRRVAGLRILESADHLQKLLGTIKYLKDYESAHRARLAAKRLRYILEPVRKLSDDVRPATKDLKSLQEVLGELRDRQVLECRIAVSITAQAITWAGELIEHARKSNHCPSPDQAEMPDACPGLHDLLCELRKEQAVLFRRLERDWLSDQAVAGLHNTRRLGEAFITVKGETLN